MLVGAVHRRLAGADRRRPPPGPGARRRGDRPNAPVPLAAAAGPGRPLLRRAAGHRRGLGEVQPALLAARLSAASLEFFFDELISEPHSHQAARGRGRLGVGCRPPEALIATSSRRRACAATGPRSRRCCSRRRVPGAGDPPARRTAASRTERMRAVAELHRRPRAGAGRRRAPAAHPRAGRGQPAAARRSSPPGRRRRRPRVGPGHGPAKRVLYLSSPIGLGHARRDVAIVRRAARQRPGVEVDWLAQHPVTEVLAAARASAYTRRRRSSPAEVAHVDAEAGEHDLHAFQAVRRMDEILVANFMLFAELVAGQRVRPVGRRRGLGAGPLPAREPGAASARAYAWMTDFVGWLPMPSGGAARPR